MNPSTRGKWISCLSIGVALALAMPALAQGQPERGKKENPPTKAAPSGAPTPAAKKAEPPKDPKAGGPDVSMEPGENHKLLEKFSGNWEGTVKHFSPTPGETPQESKTSGHQKMELGGRFLYSHWEGQFMGQEFKGVGVMGYNNALKKFQTTWVDNMGTGIETSSGTYDAASKSFTLAGEMTSPMGGGTIKVRTVIKWTGDNTYVEEMYMPGQDGKEFKMMELSLKRGSGKSEGDKHEGKDHDDKDKGKGKAKGG